MLTASATYQELGDYQGKFNEFFYELKECLKSKLQLINVEDEYTYYSCGHEYHHQSDRDWKPFDNFILFCKKKGYDDFAVKDLIQERLGRKIICECQIVNDTDALRRKALERTYGIDFSSGDCGLV